MSRPLRTSISSKSLALIGIPAKFHHISIEDFITPSTELGNVKKFCVDYLNNLDINRIDGRGIIFIGSNGVGKTMLASIILKEAYRHRYSCKRVTFVEYINLYTKVWNASPYEKEEYEEYLYSSAKAVEFLVLEEIGKEIDSKVAVPILEDLLRYREDNGLVTIICTNLRANDIGTRYGASVVSLLHGLILVNIEAKDRRK